MSMNQELDRADRAILTALQQDNKMPQRKIATLVNLSAPAVQRRIKRMEEAGIIQANIAVVNPAKVDQSITIFVEVEMESERIDLYEGPSAPLPASPKSSNATT